MVATSSEVSAGQDATSTQYNNLRTDLIDHDHTDYTGQLSNAAIASAAAIAESKLAFDTSSGHDHDGSNSKKITINRAFSFGIAGTLSTGSEQGMKYIVPQGMTVVKIWYKTSSGSASVRIQKNTTTVDTFTADGAVDSTTGISSASLAAGQVLTLDITGVSSATDLFVLIECEQ